MLTELHCHTIFSKGKKLVVEGIDSPERMIRQAKKLGIEAVALTDHDTIRGHIEARKTARKYSILFIPGEEITTMDGDLLALGIEKEIKPGLSIEETLELVHSQGGIGISPHPFDIKNAGLGKMALQCDAIEVFNAINLERISNWKARRFAEKYGLAATAGSDAHNIEMIGYGLNNLKADNNLDSVLKAIRKGKNNIIGRYVSLELMRKWAILRFRYSYEQTRMYINNNYIWPKKELSLAMLKQVKKSPGNIDYLFQALAYLGVGSAIAYGAFREIIEV